MFTLIGAMVGFVAMLIARGRAGIAAALGLMGLLLGWVSSVVFIFEKATQNADDLERLYNVDWSISSWIALVMAAAPGLLGAAFGKRD